MASTLKCVEDAVKSYRGSAHADPLADIASATKIVPATARAELLIRLLSVHDDQFRDTEQVLKHETVVAAFPEFHQEINRFYVAANESRAPSHGKSVMAQSLDTLSADLSTYPTEQDSVDLIGGRYRVQQVLGEGTFGIVYLAVDETLQRRVALKLSKSRHSESDVAEFNSFLEESRILSALEHPRILPVLDAGISSDGRQFFVSKYLSGGSLEERVDKQGPLPISLSLSIIREIAEALQHAHQHGLYHRDVKLANIVFDDVGNPFLADFGLALKEAERQQRGGLLAGSPAFMAPEQVEASSTIIDGRTDIWALGVVLYFLLTKQFPFKGGEASAVFHDILERQPQPPRQINPKVSLPLERLTLRCLEKDISKRFGSAAELSEELGVLIDAGKAPIPGRSRQDREVNHRRSVSTAAKAIVGVTSLIVVGTIAAFIFMTCGSPPTVTRTAAVANAPTPADLSQGVHSPAKLLDSETQPKAQVVRAATQEASEDNEQHKVTGRIPALSTPNEAEHPETAEIDREIEAIASDSDAKVQQFPEPVDSEMLGSKPTEENVRLPSKGEPLQSDNPAGVFSSALSLPTPPRKPILIPEPKAVVVDPSVPDFVPGVEPGDETRLYGWTQLIDEDFSLIDQGAIPLGWNDPADRFHVAALDGSPRLLMLGDGMAKVALPSADLDQQFELEFDITLQGGYHTSSLFQVDMICPGQPTVAVGVTINAGRLITTVLGADRKLPGSVETIKGQASRLRLVYEKEGLSVLMNDRFCHKLKTKFSTTEIRVGMTKYAQLVAVRLHTKPNPPDQQNAAAQSKWESFVDESFSAVAAGDLPRGWTAANDVARVEHDDGSCYLAAPSISRVQIPLDGVIESDFLLETEILIPGGYSNVPKFSISLDSPGKSPIEIGCYINANAFAVNVTGVSPNSLRKPWTEYMTDREARLRIARSNGKIGIYVGDELFQTVKADFTVSSIGIQLDKDVRVYWFRLDRRL